MPQSVKQGFVYIAQPPLYSITRKKKTDYIDDDVQLNRILVQNGVEEVQLKSLVDGKEFTQKQLEEKRLQLLESVDKHTAYVRRQGGDFGDYVERRSPDGDYPSHLVKVREGNDETVHYFITSEELEAFKAKHADLFNGDTEVRKEGRPNTPRHLRGPASRKQSGGGVDGQVVQERPVGGSLFRAGQTAL